MSTVVGAIPARLGSERLPRKPLVDLAGRPLIEWVWRRVSSFAVLDRVVVATDSEEVAAVCRRIGAAAIMTSPAHGSGTERIAEVAARPDFGGADVVVNIQGDEPFITEAQVVGAVARVRAGWDVGTVAAPVGSRSAWEDPSVVKVVRNEAGGALYFSRAPIPHPRGREPDGSELASADFLRHIGVYAYTPEALARWVALPPGRLERLEKLEQLRALAAGLRIGVAVVDAAEGGIDTPEDARRAAERLAGWKDGDMKGDRVE
ncbi:MAG: 3-deoxy-manno-octulosonate cytidylyltransferase [Gemmatimonadota bacterium]